MKQTVLNLLEQSFQSFVSGQQIAETLNMTRGNVWKEIKKLQNAGYKIEAMTNKGYALMSYNGKLSAYRITQALKSEPPSPLMVLESVTSTNTLMKEQCENRPHPFKALCVTDTQTQGKGRLGRSFYSPAKTGIYMSIGMSTRLSLLDAQLITIAAAVAVVRMLHLHCNCSPTIKWLNDIYIDKQKVCGILTEGDINLETSTYNYLVVGIGLNLFPARSIPKEIKGIYGAVTTQKYGIDRNDIIAAIYDTFMATMAMITEHPQALIAEYKSYSNVLGKEIIITGHPEQSYQCLDIDNQGYLVIQDQNGHIKHHHSGEISIQEKQHEN